MELIEGCLPGHDTRAGVIGMTFPGYPWIRISVQYNMEFRTKYFYLKLTVKAAVGSHYTPSYSRLLSIIVGCDPSRADAPICAHKESIRYFL